VVLESLALSATSVPGRLANWTLAWLLAPEMLHQEAIEVGNQAPGLRECGLPWYLYTKSSNWAGEDRE